MDEKNEPHDEPMSLEQRVQRVLETNRKAAVEFVFTEIAVGLGFCRIAKSAPEKDWGHAKGIQNARDALRVAEKYMWKLNMTHPDFDQMMEQTERLRFELENIENQHD